MKILKTTFISHLATASEKGILYAASPDICGELQLPRILASLFKEPVVDMPDYQFRKGASREICSFLQEKYGFEGILPIYTVEKDKVILDYYSILYKPEGLVVYVEDSYVTMMSIISLAHIAMEMYQTLINKFKIPASDKTISNFGCLLVNQKLGRLVEEIREDIPLQDDCIIKHYPWNQDIQDLIKRPCSGSFMFHGVPGGGKSSYVRYLAQTNPDKDFMLLSMSSLLMEGGIRFLERYLNIRFSKKKYKNPKEIVIVLEDSEAIITERSCSGNSSLATSEILNVIDGTGSFGGKVKFIFTFNQKISKADSAMLRKGRLLKVIEFTELKGDVLKEISEEMNINLSENEIKKGLSVADLVNHDLDNGYDFSNKLGF